MMRYLLLLAVGMIAMSIAACGGAVPTPVIVEVTKIVEVQVPGETKIVEVPGETKIVEVPGETKIVEVEVPAAVPTNTLDDQIAALTCDVKRVGPVTRCMNFHSDYWPLMKLKLDELHKEALAEEGGNAVNWSYSGPSQGRHDDFARYYPGMNVTGQSLQYGVTAAVLIADATGQPYSDDAGSSTILWKPIDDAGLVDRDWDWTQYGVPKEFLAVDAPYMFYRGEGGFLTWYNTSLTSGAEVPDDPRDFVDSKWDGRIVSSMRFLPYAFGQLAFRIGEEEAVALLEQLLDQGLLISNDAANLVASGEKAVMWPGGDSSLIPQVVEGIVGVKSYHGAGVYPFYQGIMKKAVNPKGIALYQLFRAFSPDYYEEQLAKPGKVIDRAWFGVPRFPELHLGNQAILAGMEKGHYHFETLGATETITKVQARVTEIILSR